ncbi:MAG: hypothetical protein K2P92_04080, partial [Bdellovibrionaceae bacterium]|nr:hypothetical protein [Pseudobdellovibrionaceae bacterium]
VRVGDQSNASMISAVNISPVGNVGIGTTTPLDQLHLNSGLTNGTSIRLTNTDTGGRSFGVLSTGSTSAGGAGTFQIYDVTGAASRLTISSAGNVGIGTTNPGYGLDARSVSSALGPLTQVYPSSTGATSAVAAKILMNTAEFDTDASFDSTNNRIRPTKAGIYRVHLNVNLTMVASTGFTIYAHLYKNGSAAKSVHELIDYNGSFSQTLSVTALMQFNGTTDYVEGYFGTNTGTVAYNSGSLTWLSAEFIRSL